MADKSKRFLDLIPELLQELDPFKKLKVVLVCLYFAVVLLTSWDDSILSALRMVFEAAAAERHWEANFTVSGTPSAYVYVPATMVIVVSLVVDVLKEKDLL